MKGKTAMDTMNINNKEGKAELEFLRGLKVGAVRKSILMPALPTPLSWKCVEAREKYWRLEGSFCGIPFKTVEINLVDDLLLLTSQHEVQ